MTFIYELDTIIYIDMQDFLKLVENYEDYGLFFVDAPSQREL